jgi:hypothetical protein
MRRRWGEIAVGLTVLGVVLLPILAPQFQQLFYMSLTFLLLIGGLVILIFLKRW